MRALRVPLLLMTSLLGCLSVPPPAPVRDEPEPVQRLWEPPAIGSRYAPGEVRVFAFRQGGTVIGHSWGRYVGPDPENPSWHRFETRAELEVPGRAPQRSAGVLVLDARGEPVSALERSATGTQTLTREADELVLDGPTGTQRVSLRAGTEAAVMARGAILHQELFLSGRVLHEGELELRLVPLSGGTPVPWQAQVRPSHPHVRIDTGLGEVIFLRNGRIERIEVADSDLEVTPSVEPWPAWDVATATPLAYEPPIDARFDRREVELVGRTGDPELWGEVLVPHELDEPRPGVVFVSSTGREDRHGFAGPPPVDLGTHAITDALAQAGFVVLRFDERGTGRSEAAPAGFLAQAEDVRRALRVLLVQPEVDPDAILLVGHGEGAWRALHAAATHRSSVVGAALLGAPGRSYREILLHQAGATLPELSSEALAKARKQQLAWVEALERGETPPELREQAQWLLEALAQDPRRLLERGPSRLWIAQGGKDFEVDPVADPAALVAAAKKLGKSVQVKRYPELDHRFMPEPGTSSPARYLEPGRKVDPAFIEDLVEWARHVTTEVGR